MERSAALRPPESQIVASQAKFLSVPLNLTGRAPALVSCEEGQEQEGYNRQRKFVLFSWHPVKLAVSDVLWEVQGGERGHCKRNSPTESTHSTTSDVTWLRTKESRRQPVYLGKTALPGKTSSRVASRARPIILRRVCRRPRPPRLRLSPPRYRLMQCDAPRT